MGRECHCCKCHIAVKATSEADAKTVKLLVRLEEYIFSGKTVREYRQKHRLGIYISTRAFHITKEKLRLWEAGKFLPGYSVWLQAKEYMKKGNRSL